MSEWRLETAELGEVVRQARSHGPQTIIVRGEQAAIVLSVEAYARLGGQPKSPAPTSGQAVKGTTWIDRLRESVIGDIDIERHKDIGRDFEL